MVYSTRLLARPLKKMKKHLISNADTSQYDLQYKPVTVEARSGRRNTPPRLSKIVKGIIL